MTNEQNDYLNRKVGGIIKRRDGSYQVEGYVLRDNAKPDTYDNRHWYEIAVERDCTLLQAARKHFGNGTLRQFFGGDRTPEFPGYAVLR